MKKTILPNGIILLSKHIPSSHAASIGIWIKTGSINEKKSENGYAHFLEHMIFKGTERRSAEEIAQEVDSAGAYINAATSKEYTTYYINIIDTKIDLALDILTDILDHSTFQQEEINKEKLVILEEIKMYEDTPSEQVQDNLIEAMMDGHPIGNPILGKKEIIKKTGRDQLVNFFNNNYTSSNIIISAAGNIDHNYIADYITKVKFYHDKTEDQQDQIDMDHEIKARNIIQCKDFSQVHFCLGFPCITITSSLRYAIYILNAIFGASMSSRLFQRIRENLGLCYSIYSFNSLYKDNGLFGVYTGTSINTFEKSLNEIMQEIKKIKKVFLTKQEIINSKEHLKGNMALAYENISTHMNSLARQEIYYGEHFTFEELIRRIDQVTDDELKQSIDVIFPDNYKITVSSIGPKKHNKILNKSDLVI